MKLEFNRNILYCKLLRDRAIAIVIPDLIETFCIVNLTNYPKNFVPDAHLIETFCIVNFKTMDYQVFATDI